MDIPSAIWHLVLMLAAMFAFIMAGVPAIPAVVFGAFAAILLMK